MAAENYELRDQDGKTIHGLMTLNGLPLPTFSSSPEDRADHLQAVREWKLRDDDIILCTLPKCGTHWLKEITTLLLSGKSEMVVHSNPGSLIEAFPIDRLDEFPSPRVLCTHLPLEMLPKPIMQNKNKVVIVMRNPKDAVVSYYHHLRNMKIFDYDGQFKFFMEWFLEGKLPYGCFFEKVKEYERFANDKSDQCIIIYYENLKTNGMGEIKRLARFLGANDTDDFCQAVFDACRIENVKEKRAQPKDVQEIMWKTGGSFYRKGIIGDWKTHLTVAQNEQFESIIAEKMKGSNIKFRFD
ncbi:sulfotransferase 1C2-like isoform X1 [Mya arenaria]|uniref:sulfotransferase 1C2-like isoform X1 n=1 Tax=Mya arenaria TaxID=6604 RepID=UPI0022E0A153|nr:sulfotransferase 1C2-like isoform X1 [Mya arenaria]